MPSRLQEFKYQGQELDIFAHAQRWKQYWGACLSRWIEGDVLEVGAGLGCNTLLLNDGRARSWHCLEPDACLAERLTAAVAHLPSCSVTTGTIAGLLERRFDTILYIDVLEHIRTDRDEIARAAGLLRPRGRILVLSPAHQFLFSEFDAAIGHYRRYNKATLRACTPPGCRLESIFYLDCVGLLASLANRLLLHQGTPRLSQIETWDRYLIPLSRKIDPLLGRALGKSIVAVWSAA